MGSSGKLDDSLVKRSDTTEQNNPGGLHQNYSHSALNNPPCLLGLVNFQSTAKPDDGSLPSVLLPAPKSARQFPPQLNYGELLQFALSPQAMPYRDV